MRKSGRSRQNVLKGSKYLRSPGARFPAAAAHESVEQVLKISTSTSETFSLFRYVNCVLRCGAVQGEGEIGVARCKAKSERVVRQRGRRGQTEELLTRPIFTGESYYGNWKRSFYRNKRRKCRTIRG